MRQDQGLCAVTKINLLNTLVYENVLINKNTKLFLFMFIGYKMDYSPRVSEALYVGLCRHIGTPTEVTIRRELSDMEEIIRHSEEVYEGELYMYSGSHREGFRFNSSDRDLMFWCIRYHIICDMSSFDAFFHTQYSCKIHLLLRVL